MDASTPRLPLSFLPFVQTSFNITASQGLGTAGSSPELMPLFWVPSGWLPGSHCSPHPRQQKPPPRAPSTACPACPWPWPPWLTCVTCPLAAWQLLASPHASPLRMSRRTCLGPPPPTTAPLTPGAHSPSAQCAALHSWRRLSGVCVCVCVCVPIRLGAPQGQESFLLFLPLDTPSMVLTNCPGVPGEEITGLQAEFRGENEKVVLCPLFTVFFPPSLLLSASERRPRSAWGASPLP